MSLKSTYDEFYMKKFNSIIAYFIFDTDMVSKCKHLKTLYTVLRDNIEHLSESVIETVRLALTILNDDPPIMAIGYYIDTILYMIPLLVSGRRDDWDTLTVGAPAITTLDMIDQFVREYNVLIQNISTGDNIEYHLNALLQFIINNEIIIYDTDEDGFYDTLEGFFYGWRNYGLNVETFYERIFFKDMIPIYGSYQYQDIIAPAA